MAIVDQYKLGGTTIKIDDSAIVTDPDQIEVIHRHIANVCWRIVIAARAEGKNI